MKIGIYGGAFNPIHNGHLKLAENYADCLKLDKVLFIPTFVPPHKSASNLADFDDRMNMTLLACKQNSKFEVSDIESKRNGLSYTYDTICALRELYQDASFYLIIGADQFLSFDKWYKWQDILDYVTLCTSARENEEEKQALFSFAKKLCRVKSFDYYIADYPVLKLSSSEVREKIKNGNDISDLVPTETAEYIKEKRIYVV